MNIVHNRTEKFITQLHRATYGEWRNTVPVAMLQKMFKATSTLFHAAMQAFVPLIDSVVDHCRRNPWKRRRLPLPGNAR